MLRLDDRVDRFLAAGLTGILHGKSASYLSEVMPNTFSMARGYVRDFVARTDFHSPERDVFACLDRKLTGCTASRRRPRPGSPCWATPATPELAPGPPCGPGPCPIGPAWS